MKTAVISVVALALAGCSQTPQAPTAQEEQANKAQAAAQSVVFEKNAEIENIQRRLKLTSNPGQIGFVLLLNQAGQPIMYTSVRGKITSGGKRLTNPTIQVGSASCGSGNCAFAVPGPSDEGTYGAAGEYVYFWTMDGQYVQWNGGYLYSDKPFRTHAQPLVVSLLSPE